MFSRRRGQLAKRKRCRRAREKEEPSYRGKRESWGGREANEGGNGREIEGKEEKERAGERKEGVGERCEREGELRGKKLEMQHGGWESVAIITKGRQLNANTSGRGKNGVFRATSARAGGETTRQPRGKVD